MGQALATINGDRILLRTVGYQFGEFEHLLAKCKRVAGARFWKSKDGKDKCWHYPLSIDTCTALRRVWGSELKVHEDLSAWYVEQAAYAASQTDLSAATDAPLPHVPAAFAGWLRGYQRAGAAWIAKGYRNAGIIGDTPGLGKTTELLAGLVEAQIKGPVLVVCPKASVKSVWGKEIAQHLPDVPFYLCYGTRSRREKEIARLAGDMIYSDDRDKLRIVVVVAEMLRVELDDPCYTEGGNKISGMCPQRRKSIDGNCQLHQVWREAYAALKEPKEREKDLVPVGFSFPQLFDERMLGDGWSAVVLDESHKLLGSMNIVKANLMGRGLKLLPYRQGAMKYPMSGTPFGKGGRAEGLFGTLNWCWPDEYTSFWRWAGEVFTIEEKVVNRRGRTVQKIVGLKGLSRTASYEEESAALERFTKSLGPRILRRTKEECLPELPPKNILEIVCEMTAGQRKQYKQLADFAEVKVGNGIVAPNGSLAFLMRSRQIANGVINVRMDDPKKVFFTEDSGKIDQLWQALEERGITDGTPGGKLIIASEFNEFLDTIMWRLRKEKIAHFRIDGSTTESKRTRMMELWQSNGAVPEEGTYKQFGAGVPRVMLLNTKAGGVSITLDAADEMHIMDEDPDPGVNEQLEDRIHRASRVHQVTIYYYRTEGSIDFKKAHDVEYRRRVQHLLLDGRRGQEYTRNAMKEALEGNDD